jgi:hypothetical protein
MFHFYFDEGWSMAAWGGMSRNEGEEFSELKPDCKARSDDSQNYSIFWRWGVSVFGACEGNSGGCGCCGFVLQSQLFYGEINQMVPIET